MIALESDTLLLGGDMPTITDKQYAILLYLYEFWIANKSYPSIRAISDNFGYKTKNAAASHLAALEKKGFIKRIPGSYKNTRITGMGMRILKQRVEDAPAQQELLG